MNISINLSTQDPTTHGTMYSGIPLPLNNAYNASINSSIDKIAEFEGRLRQKDEYAASLRAAIGKLTEENESLRADKKELLHALRNTVWTGG